MKHKSVRIILVIIEVFIGLSAISGGIALLIGAFAQWLPVAFLQGTPFSNYIIPGLVLTIVVGGGMLLAAATQFIQREWAVYLSAAMGFIMIGWVIVEVAIINRNEQAMIPSTIVQQILFLVLGLVIVGLAISLWMTKYRGQHVPSRHAGHA